MIFSHPTRLFKSNSQDKLSYDCIDNFNPINTPSSNDIIQIKLFDPFVIFRGNENESVGSLLRGEIILTLDKPMKISYIELKFSGKTKIVRLNGDEYKEEIVSQNINLLSHSTSPNTTITSSSSSSSSSLSFPTKLFSKPLFSSSRVKKTYYTFSSGIHKLSFEFHLPGSLPESVKSCSGSVEYKLKFKFDYMTTFYSKTLSSSRKVEIIRMLSDCINYSGIESSRSYDRILDYQLSIPKKSYSLDETIPIDIKIIPLINQFKLYSVKCLLVQKIYMKDDDNNETINYSNYNNIFHFNENHKIYGTTMNFELSKCNDIIAHHSVNTPLIKIRHELRFCLLISITNSGYSQLYFNVGINLLSRSVKNDDVSLPKYDDDSFYCPCHPEYQRIAEFILGDSYNNGKSCNNLTCKFCNFINDKPPQYSKTLQ
ncbi:hypothetical protein RclHR1_06140002 [Rhizophagus clarus]|uniref:Arrestin Aly1 n=1 Tax=Rhizophagus clarus TaxID=94130 RepID=A0A2Z6S7M9_9GLOM|nr:hypothetical protein RclHR1_06140002 [Rhizophagus clarus]GES95817.1 arrestin Aly1 [Rhizophagus clarus]